MVTDEEEMRELLQQYHSLPMGGHSGVNATIQKLLQVYYWLNMTADIKEYVSIIFKSILLCIE